MGPVVGAAVGGSRWSRRAFVLEVLERDKGHAGVHPPRSLQLKCRFSASHIRETSSSQAFGEVAVKEPKHFLFFGVGVGGEGRSEMSFLIHLIIIFSPPSCSQWGCWLQLTLLDGSQSVCSCIAQPASFCPEPSCCWRLQKPRHRRHTSTTDTCIQLPCEASSHALKKKRPAVIAQNAEGLVPRSG